MAPRCKPWRTHRGEAADPPRSFRAVNRSRFRVALTARDHHNSAVMESPGRFSVRRRIALGAGAAVLAAVAAAVLLHRPPGQDLAQPAVEVAAAAPHRYDTEYPVIGYTTAELENRVARLGERLAAGAVALDAASPRAALASLLAALEIDPV